MPLPILKSLDTGMVRLGFLEVLLSDVASLEATIDPRSLATQLHAFVQPRQDSWLRMLAMERLTDEDREGGKIAVEIGSMGPNAVDTAQRYVKLAQILDFLVPPSNRLSHSGLLVRLLRRRGESFFIHRNLGLKAYLAHELMRQDWAMFRCIIGKLQEGEHTTADIFEWFAETGITDLVARHEPDLGEFAIRLRDCRAQYRDGRKNNIKHIVQPRLEHYADLQIIGKKWERAVKAIYYPSNLTKHYAELFGDYSFVSFVPFYSRIAAILGVGRLTESDGYEKANRCLVRLYDRFTKSPLRILPVDFIRHAICTDSICDGGLVNPQAILNLESDLSKRYYDKVFYFGDMQGKATHLVMKDDLFDKLKEQHDRVG